MPRDRKGSQLSFEVAPEVLQRLRAHAAAERRTVAALLRSWIEAGLAGALSDAAANPVEPAVIERLEALEEAVAQLQQQPRPVAPAKPAKRQAVASAPASPDRGIADPSAGGGITTAELAPLIGMKRGSLNERIRRMGGARKGLELDGWRCCGQVAPPAGGPPRWVWEQI
jgi:predicted DNA-binding protein